MKKPLVQRALEEALTCNDSEKARQIASKLISSAVHGSVAAAKCILDFTEVKPAKSMGDKPDANLTKEQVQARLTELLSNPETKAEFTKLLFGQDKVQ